MKFIKIFFATALFIGVGAICTAQSVTNIGCTKDSAFYKTFITYLDTSDVKEEDHLIIQSLFLKQEESCFCKLLIYSHLFEYLLNNRLDLDFTYSKYPPLLPSTSWPLDSTQINKRAEAYHKHTVYENYLVIKKLYEDDVIKVYKANENLSLKDDVDNILRYGIYANPLTLKGILLTQNADELMEKHHRALKLYFGVD